MRSWPVLNRGERERERYHGNRCRQRAGRIDLMSTVLGGMVGVHVNIAMEADKASVCLPFLKNELGVKVGVGGVGA